MHIFKSSILRFILTLGMLCSSGQLLANPVYHVTIDTSSLAGQSGYLDFLFLGLTNAAPGQASLTNFSGNVDTSSFAYGEASGSASTGVTIGNGAGWNEFGQWVHFGERFRFNVQFDVGPGPGAGTDLGIALLDEQFAYLGASGNILTFSVQPGQDDQVSYARDMVDVNTNAVPEPGSLPQLAVGFLLLFCTVRRRLS
jgi:hypothetical protein